MGFIPWGEIARILVSDLSADVVPLTAMEGLASFSALQRAFNAICES